MMWFEFFIILTIYLAPWIAGVPLACRILSKSGHHWAWGLLALLPFLGAMAVGCYLAFTTWPVQKELARLRQDRGAASA